MKYRIQTKLVFDTDIVAQDILNSITGKPEYSQSWPKEKHLVKRVTASDLDVGIPAGKPVIECDLAWDGETARTNIVNYLKTIKSYLLTGSYVKIHLCSHDGKINRCISKTITL